jgi:hypothetical protein
MAKLFVFAIGGTGSRVIKALTMLLAAGVEIENTEKIIPIIIDPDAANGDLSRTVQLVKEYKNIRKQTHSNSSSFFKTEISSLDELAAGSMVSDNFKFDISGVKDQLFKDFIGFSEMDEKNKAFISLLFSKDNLDADMEVGFKGNPNIGSVVINKFKDSDFFNSFAANFAEDDRVFIISSIFGGTGAAGFPIVLKNIRNAEKEVHNFAFLNKARIGAVSVLPYFNVKANASTTIDSDAFISKTKAALNYYSRNITGNNSINALYYIGDKVTNEQDGADGATGQRNRAHFVELAAALSIIEFMRFKDDELVMQPDNTVANPKYFEFGLEKETNEIVFNDLAKATKEIIAKPLTQYALFNAFMQHHFDSLHKQNGQAWATNGVNRIKEIETGFKNTLANFNRAFTDWLQEMDWSHVSFAALDTTKQDKNILQLVKGIPEKKSFLGTALEGSGLNKVLTKLTANEPKYDHLDKFQKFSALFSYTTSDLYEKDIQH